MRCGIGPCASAFAALVLVGAAGGAAPRADAISFELGSFGSPEPLFFAGERWEGLPLTAVLRRFDPVEYVSFVYGDCAPDDDAGCAPPVEIQVWPACRRHLALYDSSWQDLDRLAVRGVPGAVLDRGTRLELQSGRSTIVVFADSRQRLSRIAAGLRPVDAPTASSAPLPPAAPGAVEGRLAC